MMGYLKYFAFSTAIGFFVSAAYGQVSPAAPGSGAPMPGATPARSEQARANANLSMEDAVAVALKRNRDIIAARLDLQEAEYDRVAAGLYPNPVFAYQIGNLVLGRGSSGNESAPRYPGVLSQTVHSVGISEIIDIWAKRSHRIRATEQGLRYKRLLLEDALREITYAVRSAFAEVVRKRSELEFSKEVLDRYSETVRLSRSRFKAGEISEAEFRKIELEGLKYQNAVIDNELERDLARQSLAALLGLGTVDELPDTLLPEDVGPLRRSVADLTHDAFENRPDMRAIAEG